MESETKEKLENNNPATATKQQAPTINQQVEMIAALFNFIKHPAVKEIALHFLENYLESKKQDEQQEKLTKKLKQQLESLKKQVKQLSKKRKTHGTNKWPPLRLIKNKCKNKKTTQPN